MPNIITKYNMFIESKQELINNALDDLNKVGSFDKLPVKDKIILYSDAEQLDKIKRLSLRQFYYENNNSFDNLCLKIRVKDRAQIIMNHKFSLSMAGRFGYLFPNKHRNEFGEYGTVRFLEQEDGIYWTYPILLDNMYIVDYTDTPKEFILYDTEDLEDNELH